MKDKTRCVEEVGARLVELGEAIAALGRSLCPRGEAEPPVRRMPTVYDPNEESQEVAQV